MDDGVGVQPGDQVVVGLEQAGDEAGLLPIDRQVEEAPVDEVVVVAVTGGIGGVAMHQPRERAEPGGGPVVELEDRDLHWMRFMRRLRPRRQVRTMAA